MPATSQERIFARARLTFPCLLATLSIFWLVSGAIGLLRRDVAARMFDGVLTAPLANAFVADGGAIDVAIGVGLLVRPWTRSAALAAIAVSLLYLVAGTVLMPRLWADPLGPFVKVLPGIALALAVAALAEER